MSEFWEDENELPYLVYEVRDDGKNQKSNKSYDSWDSDRLYDAANELLDEKKLDEALTLIDILIDRNPNNDHYWNLKGIIFYDKGDMTYWGDDYYEEAVKCFNISSKLNPNDKIIKKNKASCLIDYGNNLRLHGGDFYFAAIQKLDEAIPLLDKNDKNNQFLLSRAWNQKGMCYHSMGSGEALNCYDEALKYAPGDDNIKKNIEMFHHHEGVDSEYFYL